MSRGAQTSKGKGKRRNMEATSLSVMTFTLNNGIKMPKVGLGTYRMRDPGVLKEAVDEALKSGYRMFDTAAAYGNERALGEALAALLPKYNLEREDIFVTTKLSPLDHGGYAEVLQAYERSLENLGIDYVDLYLIHFPGAARMSSHDIRNTNLRATTWRAMTRLYDEGRTNSVGVSNFTVKHLMELNAKENVMCPVVNQVEWHPYYFQDELRVYCSQNDIVLQAYCSFGGLSKGDYDLMLESVVKDIAVEHSATPAQVLLAWALQQDVAVVPKSVSPQRIKDNISIDFTLTAPEMKALSALGSKKKKYAWDPTDVR